MTLESLFAQLLGFFQGLAFVLVLFIYMKLRERIYRLEHSITTPRKKKEKKLKED